VLRQSLSTLLDAGYFVTKSMRVDLSAGEARGTLPLLYIQLAREGCRITDVQVGKNQARIEFVAPSGTHRRTLFYYSTDLSNGPFGGGSPFAAAVHGSAPVTTYVKSASYLLHLDDFSRVRNFIMDVSGSIVEDDSGIPLRYLDPRRWQVRLYGNYTPPLNIFKEHYQPDLAAAYGSLRTRSPIDFGVGYKWQPDEACIIVAVAK
jgi:hypothetical protein